MEIEIVNFPETKVAVVEHVGPPAREQESIKKLVNWRIENEVPPSSVHRNYGVHYNDPSSVPPEEYRVDLCISVEEDIEDNPHGVINKIIPESRCAKVRHYGSRKYIPAAKHLYEDWLPNSGEKAGDFPIFFHYVNVGPGVKEEDMVTDVYLPIR